MQRNEISFSGQRIFIGIDVHKRRWDVAVSPEVGTVKRHVQNASARELFDFLTRHYPGGDYLAVYESGFSGFSTYYSLQELGIGCIVVHAADVPTTQYEEVTKSDRVDSVKLVRSLKAGLLKGIYIRERENIDDRAVVRIRKSLQEQLSASKSRVKHLLHGNGVSLPVRFDSPGTHWSRVFVRWLREDVRLLSPTRNSLDLLIRQAELNREMMLEATRKIRELSRTEKYRRRHELLTSIPGIGTGISMCILTEVYDIGRFRNEREFAAYLGLVPTSHSSGERTVHGEMTFRGNRQLRTMVVEAAWIAICKDAGLGSQYLRYKERMNPQKAIVRVARKLSNIIFAVLKNEVEYKTYHEG